MKKGQLKTETVKILKVIVKHINDSTVDYDSDNLKALLSEAMAYYDLYLLKKNNQKVEAQELESMLVPKYEEGIRAEIRTYLYEH